ncbi:5-carboxymethyl-2-hydroxymuconate Delta-isomerase [Burkholderia vietnamiensis]|uniref:5-carboxymethyl-2-hydroxymuconate Delta-isomerase n=1 Tax=Burkholderia vietnamiensis TaxID=60552 RepID=UPI000755EB4A|nr:5-carboxymethyl-2-hydroxymuconate Delta-isomerase [Burkholderia vietnamiensis]KVE99134.1 5-carboxymethyl-2-hydroxymuconate isomerase [Burkholderia vietnamiensis]
MPHLTLEYSNNLADEDNIALLCRKLARSLDAQRENDQGVFPLGGIRVRALRCDEFCIADGRIEDAAFLHGNLKIGAGRSEAAKKAAGDALFDIIKQHFAESFDRQGLALSLEINEFSEAGTWKHNNLHARLKA